MHVPLAHCSGAMHCEPLGCPSPPPGRPGAQMPEKPGTVWHESPVWQECVASQGSPAPPFEHSPRGAPSLVGTQESLAGQLDASLQNPGMQKRPLPWMYPSLQTAPFAPTGHEPSSPQGGKVRQLLACPFCPATHTEVMSQPSLGPGGGVHAVGCGGTTLQSPLMHA